MIRRITITIRLKILSFLLSLSFSVNAFGNEEDEYGISQNTLEQLAYHQTWLKLGHYTKESKSPSGFKSEIKSESFFLAKDGKNSPKLELIATISALRAPVLDDHNIHAICKFPARYQWLKTYIKDLLANKIKCDNFVSWKQGPVKSISLVYATGYLGNPASFYGHTLIKFNLGNPEKSFLLDSSINFGARVPPDENPVSYVVKGVTGGYDASFSHVDFYFHYNNYGELEKRDLWEYELALSQAEVDLIVGHLWEILDKRFTYYFLDKNCAYRMAEVLELANNFNLTENLHSWVFPQTIFSNLDQHQMHQQHRIKNVIFHPSRQSRFFESFSELSAKEREFFTMVAKDISLLNSPEFNILETIEKHKLLTALNNYFNLIKKRDELSVKLRDDIRKVHLKQLGLPTYIPNKTAEIKSPPHISRKPSYIQISTISNNTLGQGSIIYLRPAYYDSLDADNGHLPYSTLSMMGIKLAYQNNKIYLHSLKFVDIKSVSIAKSGLPGDEGKVWSISAGIQQQNLSCFDCPIIRLQGDIGRSKKITDNSIFGFGIGGAIQNSKNQYGFGYIKSTIFADFSLHTKSRLSFKAENRHYFDSSAKDEFVYSIETRWKVSDNFDVRLGYNHDISSEANMSFGYYW